MTRNGFAIVLGSALLMVAGAGCAPSLVDRHWGVAQRHNTHEMIADPAAGTTESEGPVGLDPTTGEQVMGVLRKGEATGQSANSLPAFFRTGIVTHP